MTTDTEKAAAALELLPQELREPAVVYIIEQAEKFKTLKAMVQEGIHDLDAGRVRKWDFADFLRRAGDSRLR